MYHLLSFLLLLCGLCIRRGFLFCFFLFMLPVFFSGTYAQGLKFKGNECLIDDRTSYNVFLAEAPVFSGELSVDFDAFFTEPSLMGYILRIKNDETNTIYNISFNGYGETAVFKLNEEGKNTLLTAEFDKKKWDEYHWLRIQLSFDLENKFISLKFNEEEFRTKASDLPDRWRPVIHMGRSDHVIDVPSFAIKNLQIKDRHRKFCFPLRESDGDKVYDEKGKITGEVANPMWLINDAYYWKQKASFGSQTVAGSNFNPNTREMYYFNRDSIVIYNVRTGETHSRTYSNPCPINLKLGTNFIDPHRNRLYAYEVSDLEEGEVSMAYLDLINYRWTAVSSQLLPIQLHHHGGYFNSDNQTYLIFGGFGNLHYSGNFYSYNLEPNNWNPVDFQGDRITPRYFSSLGYNKQTDEYYVFGGMGNESGDQTVGRRYYYDFYRIDAKNFQIKKCWEIPWENDNAVPVRSMIIPDDSVFYTLCYPEHFSDSYLSLYRFSIETGSYTVLGDSIPIHSEKIKTNANLYYNTNPDELYAIVQEFGDDDIVSNVKVYSLMFPPVTKEALSPPEDKSDRRFYFIIGVCIVLLLSFLVIGMVRILRKRPKKEFVSNEETNTFVSEESPESFLKSPVEERANAIYLFGEFSVRNKYNKQVSYMFSAKLLQAFLAILQYSFDGGISSQRLSALLWPDKPEDKVKNSRGVTLNHLRKILNDLDGITLVYEKGFFKLVFTEECYCDCVRCMQLLKNRNSKIEEKELLNLLSRGKFLKLIDFPVLDSFKETIEHQIEPILLVELEKRFERKNYGAVLQLTEIMFNIDPLNEQTLRYRIAAMLKLNMQEEAKKQYFLFSSEYKKVMGTDYTGTFGGE